VRFRQRRPDQPGTDGLQRRKVQFRSRYDHDRAAPQRDYPQGATALASWGVSGPLKPKIEFLEKTNVETIGDALMVQHYVGVKKIDAAATDEFLRNTVRRRGSCRDGRARAALDSCRLDDRLPAPRAKIRGLHVEPFHRMARRHDAIPIVAMPQSKRVPQFVGRFFPQTLHQQFGPARLGQPVVRNHRAVSVQLRLAKDERQHRDKQIDGGDA